MNRTNRLAFVDMLRGASILYIVGFWHLMNFTPAFPSYYNPITLRITVIILGLFVFVSGWLVGQRVIEPSKEGVKKFYVKRFLRIYPLYLGAIGLFFLCNFSDKMTLIKAAMLISMFYGPPPPTLWFITMLMVFLLVAPLLVCAAKHGTRFWALAAFIFGSLALVSKFSTAGDPRAVIYFPAFVCGIYLAHLRLCRLNYVLAFALIGCLLSIVLSFAVENFPERSFRSVPLACLGPVSIFLLSWRYKDYVPNSRSFGVLGYAGFVMYLIHGPVFVTMKWIYFPSTGILQFIYLSFVCLPLIVLASWLIQRSYDNTLTLLPRVMFGSAE